MFKQASFYRLKSEPEFDVSVWEDELRKVAFVEPGPSQQMSCGFIAPREPVKRARTAPAGAAGAHVADAGADRVDQAGQPAGTDEPVASAYPLIEVVGGEIILAFRVDTRSVPGSAIKDRVEEKCDIIEKQTGRRPGRKQQKELKEEALLDLLPYAFTKTSVTRVWISRKNKLVVMDTTSSKRRDALATAMVRALQGLALAMAPTKESPTTCMTHWLHTSEAPFKFTVDRHCEMRSADATNSKVTYKNHSLDTEDIELHMKQGKVVTKLAMTWNERISFLLDEDANVQKIEILDIAFDEAKTDADKDIFDANVAIFTGTMSELIPDLFNALGGPGEEADPGQPGAAQGGEAQVDEAQTSMGSEGTTQATYGDQPAWA